MSDAIGAAKSCVNHYLIEQGVKEVKIYELVQHVVDQNVYCWSDEAFVATYQKLFITQAAICALYLEYEVGTEYQLVTSSVSVRLLRGASNVAENTPQTTVSETSLVRPNIAFFANENNFFSATSESIQELICGFWRQYDQHMSMRPALEVLGLDESASWEEVRARYRELATAHHPDKGGQAVQFVKVREAYEALHWKKEAGKPSR